jgi:hypothetical protein
VGRIIFLNHLDAGAAVFGDLVDVGGFHQTETDVGVPETEGRPGPAFTIESETDRWPRLRRWSRPGIEGAVLLVPETGVGDNRMGSQCVGGRHGSELARQSGSGYFWGWQFGWDLCGQVLPINRQDRPLDESRIPLARNHFRITSYFRR